MARTRIMEYGPSVRGGGALITRATVSDIRQVTHNTTSRIRVDPNAVTSKSRLRRKIVKGIRQPGYFAPNYPDVEY